MKIIPSYDLSLFITINYRKLYQEYKINILDKYLELHRFI